MEWGGHPGDTLTEMACVSWGAPLLQATARALGGDSGPATYPLDDADQTSNDFGVGDGGQSPRRGN